MSGSSERGGGWVGGGKDAQKEHQCPDISPSWLTEHSGSRDSASASAAKYVNPPSSEQRVSARYMLEELITGLSLEEIYKRSFKL